MTKEELAKKRGLKVTKETISPSEALVTTKPAPKKSASKNSSAKKKVSSEPKSLVKESAVSAPATPKILPQKVSEEPEILQEPVETKQNAVVDLPKNKGGRPKTRTEDVKIANIAIPQSVYNDMTEYAIILYNSNMTEYINTLIKRDLEQNIDNYKRVSDVMRQAKGK